MTGFEIAILSVCVGAYVVLPFWLLCWGIGRGFQQREWRAWEIPLFVIAPLLLFGVAAFTVLFGVTSHAYLFGRRVGSAISSWVDRGINGGNN